ncbi:MAG: hypothetical protein JKY92_09535 [Magnetovibrio sp.]|nr:hypothetical protein [Magnetovibrio sp.]
MKRLIDGKSADFYPTPTWATRALLDYETFSDDIWECACGDGAMSEVLKKYGNNVVSTDLHDRGYGTAGIDFIKEPRLSDNIVTNPPYNLAGEFVIAGLQKSQKKFALLLRLAFLEGIERNKKIFTPMPPSRIWVFSERITFYPKGAERKGSGTTAYAWFIWDKQSSDIGKLGWIAPGHKNSKL